MRLFFVTTLLAMLVTLQDANIETDQPFTPRSELEAALVAEGRLSSDGQFFGAGWRNSRLGLFYAGHLHTRGVETLTEADVVDGETLTIDSPGGEIEAAISLAEWVIEHDIQVMVRGLCLSGCAQYVLVASKARSAAPNSLLSCHGNNIAAALVVRRFRELHDAEEELLQRAIDIYEHGGISLDFALDCAAAVEPMCIVPNDDNSASSTWVWRSRNSEWTPDRFTLMRYGFDENFAQALVQSRREFMEFDATEIIGSKAGPPPVDAEGVLSSLLPCAR